VRVDEPEPEPDAAQPAVVFPHEAPTGADVRPFDRPGTAPVASPAAATPAEPASANPVLGGEENERVLREALLNLQRIGR
jgi:hypothetical protein